MELKAASVRVSRENSGILSDNNTSGFQPAKIQPANKKEFQQLYSKVREAKSEFQILLHGVLFSREEKT